MGWMDWARSWSFQPFRLVPVQSPYARLTCAVPYLATSASSPSVMEGWALSASMSTASLAAFSLTMLLLLARDAVGPSDLPLRSGVVQTATQVGPRGPGARAPG